MNQPTSATPFHGPAWAFGGIALLWGAVLSLHLTPALFAALITFGATRAFANALQRRWPALRHVQSLALVLLLSIAIIAASVVVEVVAEAAASGSGYAGLLQQMASVLEQLRTHLPPWLAGHVPVSVDAARSAAATWLREHAGQVQLWGGHTVRGIGYAIAGVVIGGLLAVQLPAQVQHGGTARPLALALHRGFDGLIERFTAVVFAQFRIAAINTALTGVYLLGILPLMGTPIPFASTLVAATFVASLLPVVGNLLSNTMIVVVSLTQSVAVAGLSLLWLTGIHKLEYFLNAHIIGSRIRAKAWELLIAMLTMEAVFGLAGLISAPVLYAQLKYVLHQHDLL
ncbi:AI-2E family transporter [Comamonadaceae bacterium G21597-S1]|nr:AI-2E family transporter [Comamonadaceae bacterium G21597-S1]